MRAISGGAVVRRLLQGHALAVVLVSVGCQSTDNSAPNPTALFSEAVTLVSVSVRQGRNNFV